MLIFAGFAKFRVSCLLAFLFPSKVAVSGYGFLGEKSTFLETLPLMGRWRELWSEAALILVSCCDFSCYLPPWHGASWKLTAPKPNLYETFAST